MPNEIPAYVALQPAGTDVHARSRRLLSIREHRRLPMLRAHCSRTSATKQVRFSGLPDLSAVSRLSLKNPHRFLLPHSRHEPCDHFFVRVTPSLRASTTGLKND